MYSRESCDDGMRRALDFADDQVLRMYMGSCMPGDCIDLLVKAKISMTSYVYGVEHVQECLISILKTNFLGNIYHNKILLSNIT